MITVLSACRTRPADGLHAALCALRRLVVERWNVEPITFGILLLFGLTLLLTGLYTIMPLICCCRPNTSPKKNSILSTKLSYEAATVVRKPPLLQLRGSFTVDVSASRNAARFAALVASTPSPPPLRFPLSSHTPIFPLTGSHSTRSARKVLFADAAVTPSALTLNRRSSFDGAATFCGNTIGGGAMLLVTSLHSARRLAGNGGNCSTIDEAEDAPETVPAATVAFDGDDRTLSSLSSVGSSSSYELPYTAAADANPSQPQSWLPDYYDDLLSIDRTYVSIANNNNKNNNYDYNNNHKRQNGNGNDKNENNNESTNLNSSSTVAPKSVKPTVRTTIIITQRHREPFSSNTVNDKLTTVEVLPTSEVTVDQSCTVSDAQSSEHNSDEVKPTVMMTPTTIANMSSTTVDAPASRSLSLSLGVSLRSSNSAANDSSTDEALAESPADSSANGGTSLSYDRYDSDSGDGDMDGGYGVGYIHYPEPSPYSHRPAGFNSIIDKRRQPSDGSPGKQSALACIEEEASILLNQVSLDGSVHSSSMPKTIFIPRSISQQLKYMNAFSN